MHWQDTFLAGQTLPMAGVFLGFVLVLLLSMSGLSIVFVKAIQGGGSTRRYRELKAQETQAVQDLQRGFRRMEERLESLETLFIGPAQSPGYDREFD